MPKAMPKAMPESVPEAVPKAVPASSLAQHGSLIYLAFAVLVPLTGVSLGQKIVVIMKNW